MAGQMLVGDSVTGAENRTYLHFDVKIPYGLSAEDIRPVFGDQTDCFPRSRDRFRCRCQGHHASAGRDKLRQDRSHHKLRHLLALDGDVLILCSLGMISNIGLYPTAEESTPEEAGQVPGEASWVVCREGRGSGWGTASATASGGVSCSVPVARDNGTAMGE